MKSLVQSYFYFSNGFSGAHDFHSNNSDVFHNYNVGHNSGQCYAYCIEGISETPNASADFYCQSNTNNFT